MNALTGIVALGTYTGKTLSDAVQTLLDLIADPDSTSSSGAIAGGGLLDEMSPPAVAQLRVELLALQDAVQGGGDDVAYGFYTVVAADATANQTDIVTGLADTSLANIAVTITRAGSIVTADAAITEPTAGTIRVADGAATYVMTAGDIIAWFARDPSA